jgi:VanZ family protein
MIIIFGGCLPRIARKAAAHDPGYPVKPAWKTHVIYWLPVTALCLAIFVQSCFASLDMGPAFPLKDKALHMAVYGLLAVLFYRACKATWPGRMSPTELLVISVLFATFYGLSDEFHQSFVAARQADVMDGVADFAGSVVGVLGYMLLTLHRKQNKSSKMGPQV